MVAKAPSPYDVQEDGIDQRVEDLVIPGYDILVNSASSGTRSSARLRDRLKQDRARLTRTREGPDDSPRRKKMMKVKSPSVGVEKSPEAVSADVTRTDPPEKCDGPEEATSNLYELRERKPRQASGKMAEKRSRKPAVGNGGSHQPSDTSSGVSQAEANREMSALDLGALPGQEVGAKVNAAGDPDKSAYARVTETLRSFNKNFLHFVQEEEKRCKKPKPKGGSPKPKNSKGPVKASKSKKKDVPDPGSKRASKRPDLKAVSEMRVTNSILYPTKRVGPIPGIDVGHQFYSRAEMVAVGFHSHWLNGIDAMAQNNSTKKKYSKYTFPIAVAIVMSGQYEDDLDNCEDVVYTGQGGNNLLGDRHQVENQVMLRGNLALKNSMEQNLPVRVVRGHKSKTSYVGKVYTYDGLYKVVKYWAEVGVSGFTVYKFGMKRLEGQPTLTTNQVQYFRGRAPNSIAEIRGLVCEDISEGQEKIPIPATNTVDDPPVAPTGYTYCKSIQVSKGVEIPKNASGCSCKGICKGSRTCSCAKLNGSDFPYVSRDGGRLIEAKAVVFECGANCGCGPECVNRTSQRRPKYRLEVFRTPKKGWAVRSWDFIPSGAPVCEYVGVIRRTDEITSDFDNNYIFDIDCLQTMKGLDGRQRRLRDVHIPTTDQQDKPEGPKSDNVPEFCIDAGLTGNVARFINHSCAPNLFVQCVLSSHQDIKLARVVLFAADNIPPMQELTYDYGYELDSVMGPDGKIKQLACHCGAADCRKRLF